MDEINQRNKNPLSSKSEDIYLEKGDLKAPISQGGMAVGQGGLINDLKEPVMSENARYIAETRYAMKDEKGERKESVKDILWRVALNIARGDLVFDKSTFAEAT